MRISSGIAEINLHNSGKIKKNYVWPVYQDSKVDPVKKITRRLPDSQVYTKPLDSEKDRLLKEITSPQNTVYSRNGFEQKSLPSPAPAGTFFDALA